MKYTFRVNLRIVDFFETKDFFFLIFEDKSLWDSANEKQKYLSIIFRNDPYSMLYIDL